MESLRSKFKKRELPRTSRYIPQRLKTNLNGEGAQMSGYLRKKPKNGVKWKKLWFVLKDRVLYAYKAPDDAVACDTFPIFGFKLETLSEVISLCHRVHISQGNLHTGTIKSIFLGLVIRLKYTGLCIFNLYLSLWLTGCLELT